MKHGFTLIELLAVIVILAIIATIATPIVLNIIKDAKVSASKRSAENYIDALSLKISKDQLNQKMLEDGCYNIDNFNVEVNGEKPKAGTFCTDHGKIISYYLNIDNNNVENNNGSTYISSKSMLAFNPEMEIDYFEAQDGLYISGASFNYKKYLTLNYYVNIDLLKDYDSFYIEVANYMAKDDDRKLIKINAFKKTDKYYIFDYDKIYLSEFNSPETVQLVAMKNGTETRSSILNYNIVNYADHIIHKTDNKKTKDILISLINVGTATQIFTSFNNTNLAYNILEEKDRNISILSEEGSKLIDNITQLASITSNNNDQYLLDNNKAYIKSFSLVYNNTISINSNLSNASSSTILESDRPKYDVLIFNKDEYDLLMRDKSNYDSLNIQNQKQSIDYIYYGSNGFSTKSEVEFSNMKDPMYFRSYYTDGGNYYYSKVWVYSVVKVCEEKIASSNVNLANVHKTLLNLIATMEE